MHVLTSQSHSRIFHVQFHQHRTAYMTHSHAPSAAFLIVCSSWLSSYLGHERERGREKTIPNTIFSFPGPLKTASVALYWSPNACLPMQMGFVQPTS
jgi:hypothetical protein